MGRDNICAWNLGRRANDVEGIKVLADNEGLAPHIVQNHSIHRFVRSAVSCLVGAIALIPVTLICFRFQVGIAAAALLFLVIIVLVSLGGSFISSAVVSLLAVACLDYFFTGPLFTFRINELPSEVSIIAFMATSLVITSLVSRVRKQTEDALSSVSYRVIKAEERERQRIAGELHENVAQRLTLLALGIEQLEKDATNPTVDVPCAVSVLRAQTLGILNDVKALAHELHSPRLEYLGIEGVMSSFCREFSDRKSVAIDFKSEGSPMFVPPEISLCLFRVLQAALDNAVRHSGVREFNVQLNATSDQIHLSINDGGVGFNLETTKTSSGLGLNHMQERLKLVKGGLSIDSQPKRGTTIHARVPVGSERDSRAAVGRRRS